MFQHTAARRRLAEQINQLLTMEKFQHTAARRRLGLITMQMQTITCFNTQPPEGGWAVGNCQRLSAFVSTHSRPKAAGIVIIYVARAIMVSTHSRPKAAGTVGQWEQWQDLVSTHSRPKAAGASLKSLAPSGFAAPSSLSSQEKRVREYNTAFSVTPAFAIS